MIDWQELSKVLERFSLEGRIEDIIGIDDAVRTASWTARELAIAPRPLEAELAYH